jgi:phosphoribosylformylglycinamidine (FGAM) synthase-like enzyme
MKSQKKKKKMKKKRKKKMTTVEMHRALQAEAVAASNLPFVGGAVSLSAGTASSSSSSTARAKKTVVNPWVRRG